MSKKLIFKPRPYQREGIKLLEAFLKERDGVLLADEMGMGKTPQVIAYLQRNYLPTAKILLICPVFLSLNWYAELEEKHAKFNQLWIQIIDSGDQEPAADFIIISFDLAVRLHLQLIDMDFDVLIVDEAHYLKNPAAIRTRKILGSKGMPGIFQQSVKRIAVTGTPFVNGAHEGYTIAKRFGGVNFTYRSWKQRFTNDDNNARPRNKFNRFAFAPKGLRNEDQLQRILSKFMIRRMKKDHLTELPDKQWQIVPLGADRTLKKLIKEEEGYSMEDIQQQLTMDNGLCDELERLKDRSPFDQTPLATLRHMFGLAKVKHAVRFIENDLEEVPKIVISCWHRAVCAQLFEALEKYNPVIVHGGVSMKRRQERIKQFQEDPETRVFIGQLKSMGVGITLTASWLLWLVEPWYVPGDIDQVIDRLHRFGQKNPVLTKFLIVKKSKDEEILQTALDKVEDLDRIYGR